MEKKMSIELKIKSKHLSAEARIIRFEEYKLKNKFKRNISKHKATCNNKPYDLAKDSAFVSYCSIYNHRIKVVRDENRATFLARAFIAGKPYSSVESKVKCKVHFIYVILPKVCYMVARYGNIKNGITYNSVNKRYEPKQEIVDSVYEWCGVKK